MRALFDRQLIGLRVNDLMQIFVFIETMDDLDVANTEHSLCHVIRRKDDNVLSRVLEF